MTAKQVSFYDELAEKLAEFEKYRQKMHRLSVLNKNISKLFKFVYYPGLVVAIVTFALPVILPFTLIFILISAGVFILDLLLYNFVFKEPEIRFRKRFKTDIVRWVMQRVNPTLQYEPEGKIPKEDIQKAELFKASIDLYEGEDYVSGQLEGVDFQFGEATLYVDKETFGSFMEGVASGVLDSIFGGSEDDGGEDHNYVKFFNGFMMRANFNRQEKGKLIVVPNKVVGSGLFRKDHFQGKKRFETGDSTFDELFSCYTSGDIEGNSVLDSEFRAAIMELVKTVRAKVYVSLVNGALLVAVDWQKNLFEADLKQGLAAAKDVEFIVEQIQFFEHFAQRIALDNAIWAGVK